MIDAKFDLYVAKKYIGKRENARTRGIEFNLSFQSMRNLLRAKKCYYTGIVMTKQVSQAQAPTDITIDRIDSTKGYVKGNVVACCHAVNRLKEHFESFSMGNGLEISNKVVNKTMKRIKENKNV